MREESIENNLLKTGLPFANERPKIGIVPAALDLVGDYSFAVDVAGGEPVVIRRDKHGLAQIREMDALLITSVGILRGYDVPEKFWTNEPEDEWNWDDQPELLNLCEWLRAVVRWSWENKVPTLGAGLGAQLIAIEAGASIERHVDGHELADPYRPQGIPMQIAVEPGSWLADAWSVPLDPDEEAEEFEEVDLAQVRIICSHHQAIKVPPNSSLQVVARTEDFLPDTEVGMPHAWARLDDQGVPVQLGTLWEPQHSEDPEGFGFRQLKWFISRLSQ